MNTILSVAVPSYNVEQYLNKTLPSYCDERFNDILEVIIVNDGSTDTTAEIAQSYVDRYPRIFKLVNKENGGHGSAVNAGIDNATGKYFRIIDGDDWINTDNMVKLLELLDKSEADLVVDEKREVNMVTGATEFFPLPKQLEFGKRINFEDICNSYDICTYIMLHTLSVRTELLKKHNIKLLEHIFYVDIEFIIKTTMEAKTIEFYDIEIYQYLVGNVNQSVNYKNFVKRYSHHDKVTRELVRYANEKKASAVMKQYLDRRVCLVINTHMNISLIYNEDRKEGKRQAKEFRSYLKETCKEYYRATTKRYMLTSFMHAIGIDYNKLQKIKK